MPTGYLAAVVASSRHHRHPISRSHYEPEHRHLSPAGPRVEPIAVFVPHEEHVVHPDHFYAPPPRKEKTFCGCW